MSYCRFQNTLNDLRDCEENIQDDDLSRDEFYARKQLINLCLDIVQNNFTYDDESRDYEPDGDWSKEYKESGDEEDDE